MSIFVAIENGEVYQEYDEDALGRKMLVRSFSGPLCFVFDSRDYNILKSGSEKSMTEWAKEQRNVNQKEAMHICRLTFETVMASEIIKSIIESKEAMKDICENA